ncbi:hypothetical protein C8Q75DRAFT_807045 [Abortiporus biennis]|nr:hypothetical protein C8Q75DRAFT_807045 [Abortiporus biennis]
MRNSVHLFAAIAAFITGCTAQFPTPTLTTTATFTATRIYETLVPTSPYLVEETTLVVWTVTETLPIIATRGIEERAHARDFQSKDA